MFLQTLYNSDIFLTLSRSFLMRRSMLRGNSLSDIMLCFYKPFQWVAVLLQDVPTQLFKRSVIISLYNRRYEKTNISLIFCITQSAAGSRFMKPVQQWYVSIVVWLTMSSKVFYEVPSHLYTRCKYTYVPITRIVCGCLCIKSLTNRRVISTNLYAIFFYF